MPSEQVGFIFADLGLGLPIRTFKWGVQFCDHTEICDREKGHIGLP
jgi:hypothetical protein